VHVAKIMAATAVPAFADATLIPRVKADLTARVGPPLDMAAD
jgi:hypothetical protein